MPKQKTGETVLERLAALGLVSERQCAAIRSALDADQVSNADHLVSELLKRKLITRWQLEEMDAGRDAFFLENGRYLLLEKIGQGGMGAVYRARHTRMKRDVALKIIDPKRTEDRGLVDRFRREVAVCSQLQHEHIVQTHDVGEHNGALFLVMEFVEGSDLASLVRRDGTMIPGEVAAVGVQVAAALAHAHSKGIVHRDIKPSNILLSTAGIAKVLDMGLARMTSDPEDATITELTQDGAVMGTVDYMSPEQARDSHAVDPRSDIYSLGAALYLLLCGRPPYPGGTTIEKLHRLANEEPPPLGQTRPDCPRELETAIRTMMAKLPENRFQTAEDVVRALRPLADERLAGRPVVTAAVQTAAETHRETEYQIREDTLPDFTAEQTVYSTIRRRDSKSSGKWWIGGSVVAAVVVTAVVWSMLPRQATVVDSDPAATPATRPPVAPFDVHVEFPGHLGGTWALEWAPDSTFLASGGGDGLCRVWDSNTGRVQSEYGGHHSTVFAIAWSPDGRRIASAEYNGEIHIWEAMTARRLAEPIRIQEDFGGGPASAPWIEFSPDGKNLAFVGQYGRQVVLWDIEQSQPVWSEDFRCAMLRFSLDGSLIAAAGAYGDLLAWDAADGRRVFALPEDQTRDAIAFHQDGSLLAVSRTKLEKWDCRTHELLHTVPMPSVSPNVWNSVRFSPGGLRCAVITDTKDLLLVNVSDGSTETAPVAPIDYIGHVAVSPGLRLLARGEGAHMAIGIERIAGGARLRTLGSHAAVRQSGWIAVLGDRFLQTAHYSSGAGSTTWDLVTGVPVRGFPDVAHCRTSAEIIGIEEDQVVLYRLEGDRAVAVETLASLQSASEIPDRNANAPTLRFSESGSHVYTDNRFLETTGFRLWNAATGELTHTIDLGDEPTHGQWAGGWQHLHPGPHVSASGEILVQAFGYARNDGTRLDKVRVWHGSPPPREFGAGLHSGVWHADLSSDGRFLAVCGQNPSLTFILDVESGVRLATLEPQLPALPVHFQFSVTGELLLTTRQIWDWRNETMLWECPERDRTIGPASNWNYRGGALFSDDRNVVIAQDGQYQVWDWRESRKRATLFLLPGQDGYVFFNHETGHWTGSLTAFQYLRLATAGSHGDVSWLTPHAHQQQTGWENDPTAAGLRLASEQGR